MVRRVPYLLCLLLACAAQLGCSHGPFPLSKAANDAGLPHTIVETGIFAHAVVRQTGRPGPLVVFIEGDGLPWNRAGTEPAADPTPRVPLAWSLMRHTDVAALYVTRPCYFGVQSTACAPSVWTHERFSVAVTESMTRAIKISIDAAQPIVLVGHSGGGALALLAAAKLENVVAVVTLAGLIDTKAWTDYHSYEALTGSLNPRDVTLDPGVVQLHLVGERDINVPARQTSNAVSDWSNTEVWRYPNYGHRCCYAKNWRAIWTRIQTRLRDARPKDSAATR